MISQKQSEIYSRDKNLGCIDFHRKAFHISNSCIIDAFLRLVNKAKGCTIESSCKISEGRIYPVRWNLFFHDDKKDEHLKAVFGFFHDVEYQTGLRLDYGLFHEFYGKEFNLKRIRKVITGIDLREDIFSSRLKVWLMLKDYPEKINKAISMHGDSEDLRALILHKEFLVGFDFSLDGNSAIKLYPDVKSKEFQKREVRFRLRSVLSSCALQVIDSCIGIHFYIAKHNKGIILQCHPFNPDELVYCFLPRGIAHRIHNLYRETKLLDMVVSLHDSELNDGQIRNFSLYYMPAEIPKAPLTEPVWLNKIQKRIKLTELSEDMNIRSYEINRIMNS